MKVLQSMTGREWVERVGADVDELLIDHAHCERKAAGTAINLLFRYPDIPALLLPLSRLAREELLHFEIVVQVIERRGGSLTRQVPSPYAGRLMEVVSRGEPARLLDTLLCCALIEARSHERMALLATHLPDAELVELYGSLLESEARHHDVYVGLARELYGPDRTHERLEVIARHESVVIREAPLWPRMHT